MHVLVYFVEDGEGPLQQELRELRNDRLQRNSALVKRLAELGIQVDFDAIVAAAGGIEGVGRPHFAKALVASGHAEDITDAFDRWLGDSSPGYVPKARLSPVEIAKLARESGGVPVLAHPFTLGRELPALAATVSELAEAGFGGIEAYYGRYSKLQRQQLVDLAARYDLVATGGSDYHGTFKPDLDVGTGQGDLKVPDKVIESLQARRP
jgi:predicted metal-dependent phosphoesterase TrpH